MVEKKKKKWSHILIRWLGSAGACVGGATCLHHPVSATLGLGDKYFWFLSRGIKNSLLMLNGLKEASKKTQ